MEPVKTGINPAFPPIASPLSPDARALRLMHELFILHVFIGAPTALAAAVAALRFLLDELRRSRSRKRDSRQKMKKG